MHAIHIVNRQPQRSELIGFNAEFTIILITGFGRVRGTFFKVFVALGGQKNRLSLVVFGKNTLIYNDPRPIEWN